MSTVKLQGNASGSGKLTFAAPNTSTDRTLTIPDESGTLLTDASPIGKVLQVVSDGPTNYTRIAASSSTWVQTGISKSITPSSASSKIAVFVSSSANNDNATHSCYYTVFRDSTNLGGSDFGFGQVYGHTSRVIGSVAMSILDSPATTSSVTYTVYFRSPYGSVEFPSEDTQNSSIVLMEIAG